MSETGDLEPTLSRPSVVERILAFTRIKLPAWLVLLLLVFHQIPGWKEDIDFWINVAKSSGGFFAVIATIIESPAFTPALALAAVAYLILVGQPKNIVQRHPAWAVVGWCVLTICIAGVAATAIYGAFELKLREVYDQGRAGVPRGAPGETNPSHPQTPFAAENWGNITPDQMRILIQEFPKLPVKYVDFYLTPNDNNTWQYWHQFNDVFQRSGISAPLAGNQIPRGPQEEGLMLEVPDKNNISDSAQKLLQALAIANVNIQVIDAPKDFLRPNVDFAFFIGPPPIRWR